jgi:serine protease Do
MRKWFSFSLVLVFFMAVPAAFADDSGIASLKQTGKAFASVARKVSPSVVFIQADSVSKVSEGLRSSPFNDELLRRFFGDQLFMLPDGHRKPSQRRSRSQGSGFIFSLDKGLFANKAYVLTNNHVVEGADSIKVTLMDGREVEARIRGADPKSDIAVLEMDLSDVPALSLGDSSKLEVGEWVVAIGNPFGLNHTLTVGVVSAMGRSGLGINDYEDFIQTDAAINPGNSGGPLVNLDGEVVGINTAIFSQSGGYMGVGFAIPVNMVRGIADQLLQDGSVKRGYLGVVIQSLTPELAQSFGSSINKGILVAQVADDSPASRAGLRQGDVIIAYQGQEVTETPDFRNRVSFTTPGEKASLTLVRNGRQMQLDVQIGQLDEEPAKLAQGNAVESTELGFSVQNISPTLAEQFNVDPSTGVVVTAVQAGSLADMAGISVGSVILEVNRQQVSSVDDFQARVGDSRKSGKVLLLVSRDGMSRFVVLKWQ